VLVLVDVLVDVLVHVHVLVAVIDYPYPSGYGTAIGGTTQDCVLFIRGGESADSPPQMKMGQARVGQASSLSAF